MVAKTVTRQAVHSLRRTQCFRRTHTVSEHMLGSVYGSCQGSSDQERSERRAERLEVCAVLARAYAVVRRRGPCRCLQVPLDATSSRTASTTAPHHR